MNQFSDTRTRYLEKYQYLNPTKVLLGMHGRAPKIVYPCPSCGVSVTKDTAGIKRTKYCPDCTRLIRSKAYAKIQFLHPSNSRYVDGKRVVDYLCPSCGSIVTKQLNHLAYDSKTYFCRNCYSRYIGLSYDQKENRVNLVAWRRKVCLEYGLNMKALSIYEAHHVVSRGNLMSLGSECFRTYALSVKNCVFLTAEQHSKVHAGSYTPADGDLYILQQINFNSDIAQIGRFHPLYFVKE